MFATVHNWTRPRYPHDVWTFTGTNAIQYWMKHLNEADKEPALDLIMQELLRDDPIISTLGFSSDPVSVDSLREWIKMYLDQNIAVGCYLQTDYTLVAIDVLYVRNIRDITPVLNEDLGQAFKSLIKYIKIIERNVRYNIKSVCNYLTSFGIFITPACRNIKIPKEMIRMRKRVTESLRIEVIAAAFIGEEMQEAAKICGYKVIKTFDQQQVKTNFGLDFNQEIFPIEIMSVIHKVKLSNRRSGRTFSENLSGSP